MKNIHNYIMLFIVAFAVASCADDEIIENKDLGKSGDEVQFGLSLDNDSRTVYGEEAGNAFPIYWVNGDKVQIFSPQCLEGRRNAEYKVTVSEETQNYADNLEKTGAFGVQWGTEAADFYSLYPSGNYSLSDEDENVVDNVVINYSQSVQVSTKNGKQVIKSDMEDCLMYAKTEDVEVGKTVNLQYNPISTVVYLTLKVAANETGTDPDNFTIQSVSLIAPNEPDNVVNIAGTFSLNITNGTFVDFVEGSASNKVMAQISNVTTGGFHSITNNETFSIPLFLAPVPNLNVNGWKVQVVANNNVYTKTLGDKDIVAGQIHKITLPELKPATTEWDVSKWMTYIPRNVYLSEVSIPGSWNSINQDFQTCASTDAQTIQNQYNQGVRAFHLDTRWKAKYKRIFIDNVGDLDYVIGLGVADGGDNGGENSGTFTSGNKYMKGDGTPLVSDIISQLVGFIKNNPEEYIVLVCSFAQESVDYEGDNGKWYGEISAICNNNDYVDYIVDATTISNETLVGDVLGKILVIVNMPNTITAASQLPSNSKCMFTYMPSELDKSIFTTGNNATTTSEYLLGKNNNILWRSADASNLSMYNNQAQISSSTGAGINHDRGYAPSMDERSKVLNSILDWSKSNFASTDKWIYLGLGGYQVKEGGNAGSVSGSYSTIASTYNNWINNRVTEMGQIPKGSTEAKPFYPVGIALMNFVNKHQPTVKNILLLNNKYRLQYDSTKPVDYRPNDSQGGEGGDAM